MLFHYMVLYYKANRLMEKISKTQNPDSPTACSPLSRRNPLGFSGISQPDKARTEPLTVPPEPEITRPCSGKEIPTASVGGWGQRSRAPTSGARLEWVAEGRGEAVCRAGHWCCCSQEGHINPGERLCCREWSLQEAGFSSQLGNRTKPPSPQAWLNTNWH